MCVINLIGEKEKKKRERLKENEKKEIALVSTKEKVRQ